MNQKRNIHSTLAVLLVISLFFSTLVSAGDVGVMSQWVINNHLSTDKSVDAKMGDKLQYAVITTFVDVDANSEYNLLVTLYKDGFKVRDIAEIKHLQSSYSAVYDYTVDQTGELIILTRVYSANSEQTSELYINSAAQPCSDVDHDGICDADDACVNTPEDKDGYQDEDGCPEQNPCADQDKDGVCDVNDNCVADSNPNQSDKDGDGLGDVCDKCPDAVEDVDGNQDEDGCPDVYIPNIDLPFDNFQPIDHDIPYINVTYDLPDFNYSDEVPPTIGNMQNKEVLENTTLSFTVPGIDLNGDALTYEASVCHPDGIYCKLYTTLFGKLPHGASINTNTGLFTFTPSFEFVQHPQQSKLQAMWFRAYDGQEYSLWKKVDITVIDQNRAPVITELDVPEFGTVGESLFFDVEATDADGDDITYTWNFGDATSAVSNPVNHAYTAPGQYVIIVEAADNYGGKDIAIASVLINTSGTGDVFGCTDPLALNYDEEATVNDGSCDYDLKIPGCTDPLATNYNPYADFSDGSCIYLSIYGCTDAQATNYNPNAEVDDGSCAYIPEIHGCTDEDAVNYNPLATVEDETCQYITDADLAIISSPSTIATVGEEYTYCAKVNDYSLPLQWRLETAPTEMVIDADGCVTWTPDDDDTASVKIIVTNGEDSAWQGYSIQVRNPRSAVSIDYAQVASSVNAGDYAIVGVTITNIGEYDLENVRVVLTGYDFGIVQSSTMFDLDAGESRNVQTYLLVPYDTIKGEYFIDIWAGNDYNHDHEFRNIFVY